MTAAESTASAPAAETASRVVVLYRVRVVVSTASTDVARGRLCDLCQIALSWVNVEDRPFGRVRKGLPCVVLVNVAAARRF